MRSPVIVTTLTLAVIPLFTGCVQQDKYDSLLMANRSLQEQVVTLEEERNSSRENLEMVRGQLNKTRSELDTLGLENQRLNNAIEDLTGRNSEYLRRISQLQLGPLPADVESALTELAVAYPDMLTFDATRGMIRFNSDFTFDLGSTALTPDAQRTLTALANIVNSANAKSFEVRVVGHTDNVPIKKPGTRERHPTNLHLSVHRSIAVRDALVNAGLEPVRIQVAGYGEYRPMVANRTGGAAENRRVEIYLTPMPTVAASPEATQRQVNVADDNMK